MLLMRLIAPKKVPSVRSRWNLWHRCFCVLLKCYLPLYLRGAVKEILVVDGVTVTHTLCDEWFDTQLLRFGICKPKKIGPSGKIVSGKIRRYHRYAFFRWTETLTVGNGEGKCQIVRDERISVSPGKNGNFKLSSVDGKLYWLKYVEQAKTRGGRTIIERTSGSEDSDTKPKHKIKLKDKVDDVGLGRIDGNGQSGSKVEAPSDVFVRHEGFEENDIF